jgi:hypothetical protein
MFYLSHPPAKTFDEPAATEVHPDNPSPTLPAPFPLTLTVLEPDAIGAACGGQGEPGNKCTVFTSPSLDQGMPLTNTFPEPAALTIPEQCAVSASPILVAAGIFFTCNN